MSSGRPPRWSGRAGEGWFSARAKGAKSTTANAFRFSLGPAVFGPFDATRISGPLVRYLSPVQGELGKGSIFDESLPRFDSALKDSRFDTLLTQHITC